MTPDPYDFRSPTPLASDLSRRLEWWFAEVARRVPKAWPAILNLSAELRPKGHELAAPADCPAYIPEEALCFRVSLGVAGAVSLIVLPRPLMLVLLGGALGETVAGLPADRGMTVVEDSLCEYLVRAVLLDLLRETWPGDAPLTLELRQREIDPQAARLFPPGEGVLIATFSIVGAFGEIDWCWLLPRSGWLEETGSGALPEGADARSVESQVEALARMLPLDLTVQLGTAEVTLTQVDQLQPGDLILLDQQVSAPLRAAVSGAEKFRVFPGAVGSRLAARIESVIV